MKFSEFRRDDPGPESSEVRERVIEARKRQEFRGKLNSKLNHSEVEEIVRIDTNTEKLLERFVERFKLSGRVVDKILKVSRTIADLEGSDRVEKDHVLEALQYRAVVA